MTEQAVLFQQISRSSYLCHTPAGKQNNLVRMHDSAHAVGDTSNKYLRLFYDNNSYYWLEGTTQEFGVGFTWRKTMQHFKDLFRKERKMQMPAAPQRQAPGDSTKTPLVNREIK